jgi:glycosyltransferase involved in cell wall biosynthesis
MRVGVFHPGTQHSWQTAIAFQKINSLQWYATSIFYDPAKWPYKIENFVPDRLKKTLHREFTRRHCQLLNPQLVRHIGRWEWMERGLARMGAGRASQWCNTKGNIEFSKSVIQLIEREPVDAVWGYDSSSLEVFRWAKDRDIVCVLDQTTSHPTSYNEIMEKEFSIHPDFFQDPFAPIPQDVIHRQNEELALADVVVTGSEFCANTLTMNQCEPSKIKIIPYGFDSTLFSQFSHRKKRVSLPIRLLFVGLLASRKGAAYLLRAIEKIPPSLATLVVVGAIDIPHSTYRKYSQRIVYQPPVPRSEISSFFQNADCFIFPSLFEGSAIVLYEACGAGLGIIQTSSAGYGAIPDQNGVVVKASIEELIEQIHRLARSPEILDHWKQSSELLSKDRSWNKYHARLAEYGQNLNSVRELTPVYS